MEKAVEKKVFDTALILNDFYFSFEDPEYYTTNMVVEELKDLRARAVLNQGLRAGKVRIQDPRKETVEKVEKAASLRSLMVSGTDISVVALALEIGAKVITDDLNLKLLAKHFGLRTEGVYFLKKGS